MSRMTPCDFTILRETEILPSKRTCGSAFTITHKIADDKLRSIEAIFLKQVRRGVQIEAMLHLTHGRHRLGSSANISNDALLDVHIFLYRQLDFSSEPGVANEILENEPKSCLTVA